MFLWQNVKAEKLRELGHLGDFAAGAVEQSFDHYGDNAALLAQALLESGGLQNPVHAHTLLRRLKRLNPELASINLLGTDGRVLLSSQVSPGTALPKIHFSPEDQALYRAMQAHTRLTIFRPRFGVILRQWTIPMLFPVRDEHGQTLFVISQVLPMQDQQALWRSVSLPSQAFIALIREDGYVQSRWPNPPRHSQFYQTRRSGPVVQALQKYPERNIISFIGATQAQPDLTQFGAIHRLTEHSMAVVVAQPITVIWQRWLARLGVPLGLLALVAVSGYMIYRRALRLENTLEKERAGFSRDLERQVQARTRELQVANQELESFSYSVSHDLRAPLRSLDGFSHAVLEDYGDRLPAEGKQYLQRIRTAAQRMSQLIDDLLNLSRVSRSEMSRVRLDVSGMAQQIAQELQESAPHRGTEWIIEPDMQLEADPHLLRLALENLLGNAWKFTSGQAAARIEFARTQINDEPCYFVQDNGAGFDMQYADKLFGAFQRLHSMTEFEGTGIGLATVQRIVQRHGGRIWAEGSPGQGATFYFTLGDG